MISNNIIPIFVPHYGCPKDCVFCNQNKISGTQSDLDKYEIIKEIETYLGYFKNRANIELAFYGGSFTAIDIDKQKELLEIAKKYKDNSIIRKIRISTRPDCIDDEILKFLKYFGVNTIELGVQSLDLTVLEKSNRGHDASCVYTSSSKIKEAGFLLGLQQMVGLPGDSIEKSIATAKEFVKIKPDFVRIYPTLVVKDTELERQYYSGEYKALNLSDAVTICKELLKIYYSAKIHIIRVGLQPTDNIQLGKDVIAGPFHPSFRQLVEQSMVKELLDEFFYKEKNLVVGNNLIIKSSNKNINNIVGQKGENKLYFIEKYKINSIKLIDSKNSDFIEIYVDSRVFKINLK